MHVAYQIKGSYKINAMVSFVCQIIASTTQQNMKIQLFKILK